MKTILRLHVAVLLLAVSAAAAGAAAVAVAVDFDANRRPFSPLIFGVSFGASARNAQVGYPLVRWGGNSTTRYNWQADVHNTASDYFFENIVDCQPCNGTPPAGNSADTFVAAVLAANAQPLLTIPTIGWAPRADSPSSHPFLFGFSTDRYGPQQATDGYEPKAGNGYCGSDNHTAYCVDGRIVGNDPTDTSVAVDPGFEQGWIGHLRATFGTAAGGGVRLFSLDNEPMLWNSTHRDVHPDPVGYDEAWARSLAYATAIKQAEPDALVTGPVTWGYCDLFGSAQDTCHVGSDRQAHGLPFVAWYLLQVCANPLAGGAHAVDYLDLHYYPQGSNVAFGDDSAAALRLRSLKELYDPAWTSESWISDLGDDATWHYSKPGLIPRVRAWIDQYCPGTRLAITEYNWGGDAATSAALAQAELFGIFAREGVDLAARWVAPAADSKVEQAFSLFLDYDGAGGRVGGDSVAATSADSDVIGAYAFRAFAAHNFVLLTNKDTSSRSVALTFAAGQAAACALFGFDASHAVHAITLSCDGGTALSLSLSPRSANLLVFPDQDGLFRDGFD